MSRGRQAELSYWFRDKKNSVAEIDFLIRHKAKIIPVEVKSGKVGHLKSLHLFMESGSTPVAVKVHAGNIYGQEIARADGSVFKLISIPFYLVYCIRDVLDKLIE